MGNLMQTVSPTSKMIPLCISSPLWSTLSSKFISEHQTSSPKQIQKCEPETGIWIEILEIEKKTKQDIVYPEQSKQSEQSFRWDPLSYWNPGVHRPVVQQESLKQISKWERQQISTTGVSHIQINKYERKVIQHHTHTQTINQCPKKNQRQLERMKDKKKTEGWVRTVQENHKRN